MDRQFEIADKIKRLAWNNVNDVRMSCPNYECEHFTLHVGINQGYQRVLRLLCPNPEEGAPDIGHLIRAVKDRNWNIPA